MQASVHIAPMMGYTHRHFRYLMRRLCPDVLLYTEMVTTGALLHGDADRWMAFDESEKPVVFQLGGNDPSALARCTELVVAKGYDQVNLNVGCPSSRVREGGIGASLYLKPTLVRDCVQAMRQATSAAVSVKCRIGVDGCDSESYLFDFASALQEVGCDFLVVHARKAWLNGLNPKQNRTVPPLCYDVVERLASKLQMPVVLNGGITSLAAVRMHLQSFPAVMIGRYACANPLALAQHGAMHAHLDAQTLRHILQDYFYYIERQLFQKSRLGLMLQPLHGFFYATPGVRRWRQALHQAQVEIVSGTAPSRVFEEVLMRHLPSELMVNEGA